MKTPRPIPPPVSAALAHAPLRAGADPGVEDKYGHTALHDAVSAACLAEVVQHLLAAGADPNSRNNAGDTPVHFAARGLRVGVLRRLLAAGGDPNAHGFNGHTALHWASIFACNSVQAVELLLAAGGDVTSLNNDGKSPLDEARDNRDWRHPRPPVAGLVVDLLEAAGRQHDAAGAQ